jgi:hypothetical protein
MAKECVVSVVSLLRGFFGFGGLLSHPLRVLVIDGRPEGGEGTAARDETRRSCSARAEFFEGLVDRGATDVALEEIPDLFSDEAAVGSPGIKYDKVCR